MRMHTRSPSHLSLNVGRSPSLDCPLHPCDSVLGYNTPSVKGVAEKLSFLKIEILKVENLNV